MTDAFLVPKATGTHGDVFAAVGLASLLLSASNVAHAQITETAAGFEIRAESESNGLGQFSQTAGYPFLKTNDKTAVPKLVSDYVDYRAEKDKADRRRRLLQGKRRKSVGTEIEEILKQEELRPDWRLLQVLNTLQGDETSNRIHAAIAEMKPANFSLAMQVALTSLASQRPSELEWPANSVQLFTPTAAKGYSRLKPDSTDRNDKTKEQWTDPFIEWLRYRGYFAVACPFFQGQKSENVRLLCPIPHNISARALTQIAAALRSANIYGGAPKVDSLVTLELSELLIRHSEEYSAISASMPFLGLCLRDKQPADVISGIFVTNYQSLGNAKAVSAISVLALPGWFTLVNDDDAKTFLNILDEHKRIIRSLADDHSDEIGLLICYRRFLETRGQNGITVLFDFMARFGAFVLRAREQGRRIGQFTTANLEKLVMAHSQKFLTVLSDPGFQAVAAAVRTATVNAQAQKAMNRADYREIRYDLIPELRRKSSLPGNEPLIQAVSEFISHYNVENARRRELGKPAPRNVTTEEFESLIRIIEENHASAVGPILCAYGSCRVAREPETEALQSDSEAAVEQDQGGRE